MREFKIAKKNNLSLYIDELKFNIIVFVIFTAVYFSIDITKGYFIMFSLVQLFIVLNIFISMYKTKHIYLKFDKISNDFIYNDFADKKKSEKFNVSSIDKLIVSTDIVGTLLIIKIFYKIEKRSMLDKIRDKYIKKVVFYLDIKENKNIEYNLRNLGVEASKIYDERLLKE